MIRLCSLSDNKVASFLDQMSVFEYGGEGGTNSSLPTTQVSVESLSPTAQAPAVFLLPMTRGGMESSSHMTQTANVRDKADAPTINWSNQDELQDLSSFKRMKVSDISELMEVHT